MIPPPTTVAASLTALEGLALIAFAVLELFNVSTGRLTMGLSTSLFFAAYGGVLVWAAWSLWRGASWARGAIVFSQLMALGLAWSFRGGETTGVAIALTVVALLVLAGTLHPASLDYLSDEPGEAADQGPGDAPEEP